MSDEDEKTKARRHFGEDFHEAVASHMERAAEIAVKVEDMLREEMCCPIGAALALRMAQERVNAVCRHLGLPVDEVMSRVVIFTSVQDDKADPRPS